MHGVGTFLAPAPTHDPFAAPSIFPISIAFFDHLRNSYRSGDLHTLDRIRVDHPEDENELP
jgi:hypothetical protein